MHRVMYNRICILTILHYIHTNSFPVRIQDIKCIKVFFFCFCFVFDKKLLCSISSTGHYQHSRSMSS